MKSQNPAVAGTSYSVVLSTWARFRVRISTQRGKVKDFMVQLEVMAGDTWTPVMRADSAHGPAHRHLYRRDGLHRREKLDLVYADAVTMATQEIERNWETLCTNFLEGRWP